MMNNKIDSHKLKGAIKLSVSIPGMLAFLFMIQNGWITQKADTTKAKQLAMANRTEAVQFKKEVEQKCDNLEKNIKANGEKIQDNKLQQLIQNEQTKNILYELLRKSDPENAETTVRNMEAVNNAVEKQLKEKYKKENGQ